MEAFINGKVRELKVMSSYRLSGRDIVIGYWMFKPKEWVYYAFYSGKIYGAICNGTTHDQVLNTATYILQNSDYIEPPVRATEIVDKPKQKTSSIKNTYLKLNLLKIIRR